MEDGVRYLLDLAIILFAAKLFSTAGKKIGMPEVVGEILAGLLILVSSVITPVLLKKEYGREAAVK